MTRSAYWAQSHYISLCAFVSEGIVEKLDRIAKAMAETAHGRRFSDRSGDTKVAGKGQVDVFITTTGGDTGRR